VESILLVLLLLLLKLTRLVLDRDESVRFITLDESGLISLDGDARGC
jgi:hypothetical protein